MKVQQYLSLLKDRYPWVGLRWIQESCLYVSATDGVLESPHFKIDVGVQIEIASERSHQIAYGSTSDLSEEGILTCAQKTYAQAQLMETLGLCSFRQVPRLRSPVNQYRQDFDQKKMNFINSQENIQGFKDLWFPLLKNTTGSMKKYPAIIKGLGQINYTQRWQIYLTSDGTELEEVFYFVEPYWYAVAQENNDLQRRSFYAHSEITFQGPIEQLDSIWVQEEVQRIAIEAKQLIYSPPCPSERIDLVLDPHQMGLQIHESIGHPLELDRILGDERNYAGWSFLQLQDFGKLRYGSSLLNIVFDPMTPKALATYSYDDVGTPAQKEFLIKEGILLRPLGGIESQQRSGLPGVANLRTTSWTRPPIDRMANINLLPGTTSFEDIISSIEYGVLMKTNRSWSIDDYRRNFQFGCEYGQMIRQGKLAEIVKNPNYRGECLEFWNSLAHVGNETTVNGYHSPFCGKGEPSQIIRVSHSSPIAHFKAIEVFGG